MNSIITNTEQYPIYIAVGLQVIRCLSDGFGPEKVTELTPESSLSIKHFGYAVALMVIATSGVSSAYL